MKRIRRVARNTVIQKKEETVGSLPKETEDETMGRIENKYRKRADSPLRAIRAFCVLCMGCKPREVGHCGATECVLHPFRFGRNPFGKHVNVKKK